MHENSNQRQHALSELGKLFVKSQNPSVTGRALRQRLARVAPTLQEQRVLTESLVPEYAEHTQANTHDDYFRPTLRGLLCSYQWTDEIVRLTLAFFREKSKRQPDFISFTWAELSEFFATKLDDPDDLNEFSQLAVLHVLDVAGLSTKWYGTHWGTPAAIEQLLQFERTDQLLDWNPETSERRPTRIETRDVLKPATARVFIGHGTSSAWRDLRDFLRDELKVEWDEFNRTPTAGKTTQARLKQMLDGCSFAFLVMTGDDVGPNGSKLARPNVVHELGLFQGRLGFERAIVLLENGCAEFSNIVGLTQMRFHAGGISAVFDDVREVLELEGLVF